MKANESIDFNLLVGQQAKLYLHKPDANCFQLGSVTFECIEDENDGYRSMMEEVKIKDTSASTGKNKFLALVTIGKEDGESSDIYKLTDDNGHVWLKFGTDHTDDYYPCFVFRWQPIIPKDLKDFIAKLNK